MNCKLMAVLVVMAVMASVWADVSDMSVEDIQEHQFYAHLNGSYCYSSPLKSSTGSDNYYRTCWYVCVGRLVKFYLRVWSLPPGPIPLPLIGNLWMMIGKNKDLIGGMTQLCDKYPKMFTFWMATRASIVITDIELSREVFRKNEFAGRPTDSYTGSLFSNEDYTDIVFTNYGPNWEALRRVAHSAVHLSIDDPEFLHIKYVMKDYSKELGARLLFWEMSPLFRSIDRKEVAKHKKLFEDFKNDLIIQYRDHYKDYSETVIRDFCDALISAKNEALRDHKESARYLTDNNLAMAVFDLFLAGTDTSQITLRWMLLFLSYYPEVQRKLRQEIETQIGDRMPTHEDRNRCHYVMAFIAETLRFRNVAPQGVPHSAVVDTKIDGYSIPKGMIIFVFQGYILNDEKHWTDPHKLTPERFLDSEGRFMTTRPKAYIPFGVGRRVCLGEKLAIADLFLVLVTFLQSTQDYDIILDSHNGLDNDPKILDAFTPKDYKIIHFDSLINFKQHFTETLSDVSANYGSVFTFWLGYNPFIVITDIDIAKDIMNSNAFAGRAKGYFASQFSNENYSDIIFADYGHTWEALRRVAHSAVHYNIDDPEYKRLKYVIKDFAREQGIRLMFWEFVPISRYFDHKMITKQKQMFEDFRTEFNNEYKDHYKDYSDSVCRDFCDALITAKNEALREGKESAPYLTDDNLAMAVMDLFLAGTDTSQFTFRWLLLLMTYYPEVQQRLRQEIETQIGDRMPTHEDRNRCHYVMAFIAETLRFRNVVPFGSEKYFTNAHQFHPERFLDNDGQYMTTRPKAYIPFGVGRRVCLGEKLAIADLFLVLVSLSGVGRRVCLGEKLAIADLFLVLVRFLQSTQDYDIVLDSHNGIDGDPKVPEAYAPKDYKISFNKK
ncbi:unnamed protein product [Oppiella nova]|uniref:Cytochrome P450 n=1 Tax=Oppiella nova TaxID=334625 RepID=A0A7R9LA54_9ACAR|nr:unnamed protein product [Oppiella nova]CAG2161472.1 unnamed protein product [Oppiella nova]